MTLRGRLGVVVCMAAVYAACSSAIKAGLTYLPSPAVTARSPGDGGISLTLYDSRREVSPSAVREGAP